MLLSSTNKTIQKRDLLNCSELNNFFSYVQEKYTPNVVQCNSLVKTYETNTEYKIEFVLNQKYGDESVDMISNAVIVYDNNNSSSTICDNISSLLLPNDVIDLVYNDIILESCSFSTIVAKLGLTNEQIKYTGSKKIIFPLNFGILSEGFLVNMENSGVLKVVISITKYESRLINLDNYKYFQLRYKSLISPKYKIKNSSATTKLLNHYFSHPTNQKLIGNTTNILSKITIEPDMELESMQPREIIQSTHQIPMYKTIGSDIIHAMQGTQGTQGIQGTQGGQIDPIVAKWLNLDSKTHLNVDSNYKIKHTDTKSYDIRAEPPTPMQTIRPFLVENQEHLLNYSHAINDFYNQPTSSKFYDYENVQPYNAGGFNSDGELNCFKTFKNQILPDYVPNDEINDEIEEYKKSEKVINSQYFQKKKLFNKKISLFCDMVKEIECSNVLNKNVSFQSKSLNKLYFYFTSDEFKKSSNPFESVRLKMNGKTIYEAECELVILNNSSLYQLFSIQINNSESNTLDTYELVFDGLEKPLNIMGIKLFEISKYLCCYSRDNYSPSPNFINL